MYIVKITNGNISTPIHNEKHKLKSGSVVKGINTIDSFSFALLPDNPGFDLINDFTTLVSVYNTNKKRYDFYGRVLYSNSSMDSDGLITKEVTCESYFGFLCDSQQPYTDTQNWTVSGLLQHIIDKHNEQVEEYKRFKIGLVTVTDPNDNLYIGIQRENTWKTIQDKLIGQLGGELRFRVEPDGLYIDYLYEIGVHRATEIKMSRNMKSITKEVDPSSFISRLIPLGCKLTKTVEGEEVETEERLDISSVNDGKIYIDVENGVDVYGIHVGYAYWDDVTEPSILLTKARNYLAENNRVLVKYSISAIDLSLLGLDIDDFDVHNYHPIINPLLGIDDEARITKKNIDICNDVQSNIEIGDNFKTLSEIQRDQLQSLKDSIDKIKLDTSDLQGKVSVTQNSVNKLNTKVEGIDGTYLYIMYSPYEDGHEMTDTPDENTMYMGTCSTSAEEAPKNHKLYTWVKVRGIDGKSVSAVENYYMVTDKNSGVTNTDITQWKLNTIDKLTEEKPYLWNFERTVYSDDSFTDSEPALIGNFAKDGDKGVGIKEIQEWYGLSATEGVQPTSWSQDLPTMTETNRFLWNYEKILYTEGDPVTTEPLLIGVYGQKGENGRGIETVTNYYLASASSSGVTTSTTGWKDTIQSVSKTLPYLWTYEKITYTSGTPKTENTTPVIIAKYTENGSGISKITDYYAVNNDPNTVPTNFTTDLQKPTADNRYLWNYEYIEYTEGKTPTTSAKRIIGVYGEKGEQGEPGASINTITEYYARSSSSTTAPADSSFGTSVPELTATYKYLWNYEKITYTGGKEATTTPKSVIGVFGKDGKGISSITEYYLATSSSSGVTTSTSGWKTTPQVTTSTNKYLWNYEIITYTDTTTHTTTPCIIGVHGEKGDTGESISAVTNYYLASSSASGVTTSTSGWSTDVSTQTLTETKKYLWNYEKITYTGSKSATTTAPCIIGVFGKDGVSISSVTEYYAKSSSSTQAPADSSFGTGVPALDATNKYLWNYEKIEYTGGKTATTTPKTVIGVFGVDGKTQYWHIKYSDDGKNFTANNGETLGAWIGTYVDFNETDSTTFSDYTWKKFTEDVDEELEEIRQVITQHSTDIERTEEEIGLIASKSYVEKTSFDSYKEEVSTEFAVRAEGVNMQFIETREQITNVDGDLQSKFEKINKYITFNQNGITIGGGKNAMSLVLDNDNGIVFARDGVPFGWWDGNNFHTGNIVVNVNERAQFGNFAFIPRSSGSLSLLKVSDTATSHTHSYKRVVIQSATCTENGIYADICECGTVSTGTTTATGHSYSTVVTATTDTTVGYITHSCANCGDKTVIPLEIMTGQEKKLILNRSETVRLKFVPQVDGNYTFSSLDNSSYDPDAYLYSNATTTTATTSSTNSGAFSMVCNNLKAGTAYYLGVKLHSGSGELTVQITRTS